MSSSSTAAAAVEKERDRVDNCVQLLIVVQFSAKAARANDGAAGKLLDEHKTCWRRWIEGDDSSGSRWVEAARATAATFRWAPR
mmetsp:Transcript_26599/g.58287  ORF Transcript_26599/g.58287 Transcript_26599/m.58287 type:complete len:84 (-) Transcript_26599:68-319(-)